MSFNPEKLNIKDLTIEEPEKQEVLFDPEEDITEEDWKGMWDALKQHKEHAEKDGNWTVFSQMAMLMKTLDPKIEIEIEPETYVKMKKELSDAQPEMFGKIALGLKFLGLDFEVGEKWKDMKEWLRKSIDTSRTYDNFSQYDLEVAMEMKVLNPKIDVLNENDWKGINKELKNRASKGHWITYFTMAEYARILSNQKNFDIPSEVWQQLKSSLQGYREKGPGEYYPFALLATSMKVIAADQVEVTDAGLKLTMPGEVVSEPEIPTVPEKRNF